jgi:tetratricopeptide (TPR) repeat protein
MNLMLFVLSVLSLCDHNSLDCKSVQAPATAELNTLATTYLERGQFEDARKTFARLLLLLDSSDSAHGIEAARVYQLLGEISQIEVRIPDAEAAFKKAVALWRQHAGRQDFNTASALNSLGWLYCVTGRPKIPDPCGVGTINLDKERYSARKASTGSTLVALRAGR